MRLPTDQAPKAVRVVSPDGLDEKTAEAKVTLGAKLQWQVDGVVKKTVDLPDRDGKNDAGAWEYDRTYDFPIPPGRHRLTLDNVGGDWASIGWYALAGETEEP